MVFDPEEDPEYLALLKKAEEWSARGAIAPMAVNSEHEPIFDENLPLGSEILIPAFNQGWDWCVLAKDDQGYYAQSRYEETYRLAFGPNWHVISDLPPQY
jgi:hypothetical protein